MTAGLPVEFKNALILQNWIKNYCQMSQLSQLSQRIVLKEGPNQLREKQIRDDALKILEEHGSVILITEGKKKIIKVKMQLQVLTMKTKAFYVMSYLVFSYLKLLL